MARLGQDTADDVDRIDAERDYVRLHVAPGEGPPRSYLLLQTVSGLEARLDPSRLMRVRRSAFVRLDAVRRVTRAGRSPMQLYLEDGALVDVGPTYAKAVMRALRLTG